ncbi:MAG: hypothetical protein HYY18_17480 [Planctomycetes bacterium]|nr:hypothetical protein [Planctomycetota bacterium]
MKKTGLLFAILGLAAALLAIVLRTAPFLARAWGKRASEGEVARTPGPATTAAVAGETPAGVNPGGMKDAGATAPDSPHPAPATPAFVRYLEIEDATLRRWELARVTIQMTDMPIDEFLRRLHATTGLEALLPPDLGRGMKISINFKDRSGTDVLHFFRNYALLIPVVDDQGNLWLSAGERSPQSLPAAFSDLQAMRLAREQILHDSQPVAEPPELAELRKKIEAARISVSVEQKSLQAICKAISGEAGVSVGVVSTEDWVYAASKVVSDFSVSGMPLPEALDLLAARSGLEWCLRDEMVMLTGPEEAKAEREMYVRLERERRERLAEEEALFARSFPAGPEAATLAELSQAVEGSLRIRCLTDLPTWRLPDRFPFVAGECPLGERIGQIRGSGKAIVGYRSGVLWLLAP